MLKHATFAILGSAAVLSAVQAETAVSLFMKKDELPKSYIASNDGDLYSTMGHHGPAVENDWAAWRVYFNQYLSVDILSKFHPRLELAESKWYRSKTDPKLKAAGYGKDNYKVGQSIGLGGVRLWDPKKKQAVLADVSSSDQSLRYTQVMKQDGYAKLRVTNIGVPYMGKLVDFEFVLTAFDDKREVLVDVFVLSDEPVNFVTGLTVHDKLKVKEVEIGYIYTWGDYDSPAAAEAFDVGAAVIVKNNHIKERLEFDDEWLLVSYPTRHFQYRLSTANAKEIDGINTLEAFQAHLDELNEESGNYVYPY